MSGATLVPSLLLSISLTGPLPSLVQLSSCILLSKSVNYDGPQPHTEVWFGLFPFRSPLLRKSIFFLFLRLLRCFSSPGFLLMSYGFTHGYTDITLCGFPHSEICGSIVICTSPQLIAACHVLLRLLLPRHPPYALLSLILFNLSILSLEFLKLFSGISPLVRDLILIFVFEIVVNYLQILL